MRRSEWPDLPQQVRAAVQDHTGPVAGSVPVERGEHADFRAVLDAEGGRVFVKGMRTADRTADLVALRREARINPHVTHLAPYVLWEVEAGGWLLAGFEYVAGRHLEYAPGSPDLEHLALVVERLGATPTPAGMTLQVEQRWPDEPDLSPLAGERHLLHTDLNPGNLLATEAGRVYVVDWGHVTRGAAWLEQGLLIPWLIQAGHAPVQADEWLSRFRAWRTADSAAVDLFSKVNADRWARLAEEGPARWRTAMAEATRAWAEYRTSG
ncbi:phosphotransferase [Sphaerisporangium sp. B11E5]|uniref:phosphotransferase n=1 Tax=Sphaerisporangium sp. B11E5 TaxID=3153563 RepID=UPI00325D4D16